MLLPFVVSSLIGGKDMKYEAVIFDLDGTLLDTLEDLRSSVNHALRTFGLPERSLEEIRSFVGNGVRNLMLKAVPGGADEPRFEEIFAEFKRWYAVHWREVTCPYEGVVELVQELHRRGLKLAVVSNKSDVEVKKLCEEFFAAFVREGRMALHLRQLAGSNSHHIIEGAFKAAARALRCAVAIDPDAEDEIPSTKGIL